MRRRLLLLTLPTLAACSVLPEYPYVEVKRFPLAPRREAPPARGGHKRVLLVRLMRASPALDTRGLRSLRPDGTEAVDFYAEWTAPPAELAEEALRRWLTASGLFAAVVTPGSRAQADLILESELTALLADLGRGEARAGLSAVVLRESGDNSRILAQLSITGTAPLPPERPLPPEAVAAGINAAFAAALRQLESQLARFA
ncbi:hypothetical protein E0493_20175 [Roseomonas sp. M0104]|uniref:ABC-type transport auxiliary lipoprotein component domain-containing protein n=1 Tax=Teichococcus coralli TaxID=2545983 RepID=A0A845BEY2_9PROT|nr:ABC-type transport auxiliary lipoprotein family protein [Pseudoroseomonas coralli]MXP65671.1 hypothetical protein [Pseudoroseomonas coralli]